MPEELKVIVNGEEREFEAARAVVRKAANGRYYLNYNGGRATFVLRGCTALFGVAAHSKFQPKISLVITDHAIIAALNDLSIRGRDALEVDHRQTFKAFLSGDHRLAHDDKKIALKIMDDSVNTSGDRIQGHIGPGMFVDVQFGTVAYNFNAYAGFSHRLQRVTVHDR